VGDRFCLVELVGYGGTPVVAPHSRAASKGDLVVQTETLSNEIAADGPPRARTRW
jgi:hypothetical protein